MQELHDLVAYAKTKYAAVTVVGHEPDRVVSNLYALTRSNGSNGNPTLHSARVKRPWNIVTWDLRREFMEWSTDEKTGDRIIRQMKSPSSQGVQNEFGPPPKPELDATVAMANGADYTIYCLYNFHHFFKDIEVVQEISNNIATFK